MLSMWLKLTVWLTLGLALVYTVVDILINALERAVHSLWLG